MEISKNKTMAITVALILMLTITSTLVALPIASAHDPPQDFQTHAYLAITPSPVGVSQSVYLVMWIHPNPPTAEGIGGDRWRDLTVTVTKPNGDTQTLGPWISDPTGSTWAIYTPDQVGTYKFVFNYPGQVISLYHPETGIEGRSSSSIGDNWLGSSTTVYLTVQEDAIAKIPQYPLPTEYWTRPIEGQNTDWASIASNWLRGAQIGHTMDLWQETGIAPNSPHIMWTMPIEFGGIVGGINQIPDVGFYSGGAYEGRFANSMIISGKLYFQLPQNHAGGSRSAGAGYICLDLQTGEQKWLNEELGTPARNIKGQLFNYESMNQHGVVGGTIFVEDGSTWIGYDAWTGNWIFNLTDIPSGTEVYTDKGEIVRYVFNYDQTSLSGWLALWNNTQDNVGLQAALGTGSSAYQWRPMHKVVNMSTAYSWNVSITADLTGDSAPRIAAVLPGDVVLGTSASLGARSGTPDPYTIWAISDRPETRGQLLWKKSYPAPAENISRVYPRGAEIDAVNRVFVMNDVETFAWYGYSIDTGELLWGPVVATERAFSYYGGGYGAGQIGTVAYGNIYIQNYGGELACINLKDGTVEWNYDNTNSGVETIWGNYPIFVAAVADGKVYAFNNEHSPNYPLYKGEHLRCIDAYTGEELWTLMGWAGQIGGGGESTTVVADGFLVYYNYYDNQIYCVGKGPSATTVTAPGTAVPLGSSVVISGMVTDESSGTKQDEQAARFPHGVPAVSDDSMGEWMKYVYMQKPCPMDVTGVEVTLDAVDSNGNFINIGRVRSDGYGFYSYMWTPENEGKYTIIATFEGSDSYWASYAETAIGVDPASSPAGPIEPEPTEPSEAPLITTEIAILAAVVVVAVIGIVAYWALKKRK